MQNTLSSFSSGFSPAPHALPHADDTSGLLHQPNKFDNAILMSSSFDFKLYSVCIFIIYLLLSQKKYALFCNLLSRCNNSSAYWKQMESDGIVIRTVYPEVPVRTEYSLSSLGQSMLPIITTTENWGNSYKSTI